MIESQPFDIVRTLAPVRRRLSITRVSREVFRGLAAGTGLGVVILAFSHLWPFSGALPASLAAIALGALAGVARGLAKRPDLLAAARSADRHFGLDDRLTTALEFRASTEAVSTLQRADVFHRLTGLNLGEGGGRLTWRETGMLAPLILAFAALLLLGGGPRSGRDARGSNAEGQRITRVASLRVPAVIRSIEGGLTPAERQDPALRKMERALTQLQRQLLHASSRATALRAVSGTQQQLQRISSALHPLNSQAVTQLNWSLRRYATKQDRSMSAAGTRKAAMAAANTLSRLASQLRRLKGAQRQALQRALQQAAASANDPSLRRSLTQASSAMTAGQPRAAASALQRAAGGMSQAAAQAAERNASSSAGSQLDSLKNDISGLSQANAEAGGSAGSQGGQPAGTGPNAATNQKHFNARGQPAGRGQGNGPGSCRGGRPCPPLGNSRSAGSGQGQGAGFGGKGQGACRGGRPCPPTGQGRGREGPSSSAKGSGQGGPGSRGSGGTGGTAGPNQAGKYVTIFVPSKQRGGRVTSQGDANGGPQQRVVLPYRQVIGKYKQSARLALDRAALPPGVQSYVRQYFTAISQ